MEDPPQTTEDCAILDQHSKLPDTEPIEPIDSGYASRASSNTSESDVSSQHSKAETYPLPPESTPPTKTLDVDLKTPDAHVYRDPRLIRLTGVHPFNVEAPLSALFNEGFLTSPELFYVRNHGAVPEVLDSEVMDWTFSVEGLVEKPFEMSLRQLMTEWEQITTPVTLVCAGNRRKEQNVVRKSKGFSWGSAGVSTALWTGIMMSGVVKRAKPLRKARYVCMEGADKLPNGYYGTSVKLNWVMDPNRGIMLAHGMNGQPLSPDHGKPLRAVIPGQIGGRSVKWLKKIILTDAPSDNWYHIYDNRVLPTMVSPEESANNVKWWTDERYAIYDLSINSAAAYPAHDETLSISSSPETYSCKGYAYSGGGKRVTRVEVSLDQGKTWRLADIDYPEDRYRETEDSFGGGKIDMWWREASHCWCFWAIDLPVAEMADAKDVLVRAMDESMQIMPRDMYWSVLGMMNNPWYRVSITRDGDTLKFEHPTQPALMPGGWMERVKKAGGNLTNGRWGEKSADEADLREEAEQIAKEIVMTKEGVKREIELEELRAHEGEKDPWFVVNGEVYDGTAFLEGHPGGAQSIVSAAATDASDEFMAIREFHFRCLTLKYCTITYILTDSETAKAMMPTYHIGTLSADAKSALVDGENVVAEYDPSNPRPSFLQSKVWTKAVLSAKRVVSWDTRVFTFSLEHEKQALGLPTGQHLMIRLRDPVTREAIIRSYTPISEISDTGKVDVLVKVYFDQAGGLKGGKMSQALDALPIGHGIDFKGPIGKFEYLGKGRCVVKGLERQVKRFLMICGGSGVTPVYQVFRAVMQDSEDETRCVLLDGNRLVEDILCKEELDDLEKQGGGRGQVVHTLSKAPDEWTGLRGRINGDLARRHCPCSDGGDTMALICGPEALEKAMHAALLADGWKEEDLLFF